MTGSNFVLIISLAIIFTFLFTHMNYKKYPIFSTLNELLLFRKMLFNKKLANCAGKKTIISFFFFVCYYFIHVIILMTINLIDIFFVPTSALYSAFSFIVVILILRLIYEFIVIPIGANNNQAQVYQQNIYMQYPNNQQPFNTPYSQQNYTMPQSQATTYTQPQQPNQEPSATEVQFKFCTQCGTRYNASDGKCPNCGMK